MKYFKNMFIFYTTFVINFLLNFVFIKLLTNYLDQSDLGRFFFASNLGLFAGGLFLLGFPLTFQRYIPQYLRDENYLKIHTLIQVPAILHFLAGMIITIPVLLIGGTTVALVFFAFYSVNTLTLYQTAYISMGKIVEYTMVTSPRLFLVALLTFTFRRELSLVNLGLLNIFSNMLFLIVCFRSSPISFRGWREVLSEVKEYWNYSALNQILSPFFFYIDSILIPIFLPFSQLSLFQISRKLDMAARQTLEIPLQLTAPLISFKKTDELLTKDFAMKYRAFRTFYFYLALLWFLLFQFGGKVIIKIISNSEYISALPYLVSLSFTLLISSIYAPDAMLARSTGNIKLFFYKDIVYISTFLISFFILTPQIGLPGVSLSFMAATILTAVYHIQNFKVLHHLEYIFDGIRLFLFGVQAIIFLTSANLLITFFIIITLILIDLKNLKNSHKIFKEQLRGKVI
ncbi:MAG: hypothetical protein ABIM30_09645 [candidate division WOR-3 bacterium]